MGRRPPAWLEPALRRVVLRLLALEADAPLVALGVAAESLLALAKLFPHAPVLALVRDGRVAPEPLPSEQTVAARDEGALEAGDAGLAVDWSRSAHGNHPAVRYVRGRALHALGDTDAAVAEWRAAVEHPDAPDGAWVDLLAHAAHRSSLEVAARARVHGSATVRMTAARWLVARSLDAGRDS